MGQFKVTLENDVDTYLMSYEVVKLSNGEYRTADELMPGMELYSSGIIKSVIIVPTFLINDKVLEDILGVKRGGISVTYDPEFVSLYSNEIIIGILGGGVIQCDTETLFNIKGEEMPVRAKRLIAGDVMEETDRTIERVLRLLKNPAELPVMYTGEVIVTDELICYYIVRGCKIIKERYDSVPLMVKTIAARLGSK
jgi:hypothetical protein